MDLLLPHRQVSKAIGRSEVDVAIQWVPQTTINGGGAAWNYTLFAAVGKLELPGSPTTQFRALVQAQLIFLSGLTSGRTDSRSFSGMFMSASFFTPGLWDVIVIVAADINPEAPDQGFDISRRWPFRTGIRGVAEVIQRDAVRAF